MRFYSKVNRKKWGYDKLEKAVIAPKIKSERRKIMNKKFIKRLVAGCLAAVCTFAVGITAIATDGFGYYASEKEVEVGVNTDMGAMNVTGGYSNGIKLMNAVVASADYEEYGISPLAETAQLLTATITPANATNKAVTWSVAWKNSSSTWASGKNVTDYVTVTPTSTGANTATVGCLQAFGEQVIVTVTSQDNASVKATCTVDYAKRITSFTGSVMDDYTLEELALIEPNESITLSQNIDDNVYISNMRAQDETEYSAYTVDDTFALTIGVTVNDTVLSQLNQATGFSLVGTEASTTTETYLDVTFTKLLTGVDWTNTENYNKLNNWLMTNTDKSLFTVTISYEGQYSSYVSESPVYFSADGLRVAVSSVTLDQGSLLF